MKLQTVEDKDLGNSQEGRRTDFKGVAAAPTAEFHRQQWEPKGDEMVSLRCLEDDHWD